MLRIVAFYCGNLKEGTIMTDLWKLRSELVNKQAPVIDMTSDQYRDWIKEKFEWVKQFKNKHA